MELTRRIEKAQIVKCIAVKTLEGEGTKDNPIRAVTTLWSMDGKFLATLKDNQIFNPV